MEKNVITFEDQRTHEAIINKYLNKGVKVHIEIEGKIQLATLKELKTSTYINAWGNLQYKYKMTIKTDDYFYILHDAKIDETDDTLFYYSKILNSYPVF